MYFMYFMKYFKEIFYCKNKKTPEELQNIKKHRLDMLLKFQGNNIRFSNNMFNK